MRIRLSTIWSWLALAIVLIWTLLPLYWFLKNSLLTPDEIARFPPPLYPLDPTPAAIFKAQFANRRRDGRIVPDSRGRSGRWITSGFGSGSRMLMSLTAAQRKEVAAVLSDPPEGAASLAAIELGVDDERRCPHCASAGAVSRGKARGLRRYRCKACGKTFGALTGTALSGLHHKERWLAFGASLGAGETIREAAERCGIAPSTAHRWRHRFLAAVRQAPDRLAGIVEADETFVLESRKGERKLDRKPRRRGGKARKRGLSREQVPILVAADRAGATLSHTLPALNARLNS